MTISHLDFRCIDTFVNDYGTSNSTTDSLSAIKYCEKTNDVCNNNQEDFCPYLLKTTSVDHHATPPPASLINNNNNRSSCFLNRYFSNSFFQVGSLSSSIISFVKVTLGAGTLGIPSAYATAGSLVNTVFLVFSCIGTIYSIRLLGICADLTDLRTYEQLSHHLVGKNMEYATYFLMLALTWGGLVIFLVTIRDILSTTQHFWWMPDIFQGVWGMRLLITLFWLFIMLPMSLPRQINTLRYASLMGIITIMYLTFAIVAHSAQDPQTTVKNLTLAHFSVDMIQTMPIVMFSFGAQANVFEIYTEMKNRNVKKLTLCATISQSFCATLYVVVGLAALAEFGKSTNGNILKNLDPLKKAYISVAFFAITFNIILSFPMSVFPSRDAVLQFIGYKDAYSSPSYVRIFVSGLLALTALMLSFFVPNIQVLFIVIGSLSGGTISFVWPCVFVLCTKEWTIAKVGFKNVLFTWVLLIAGLVASVTSTVQSVYELF